MDNGKRKPLKRLEQKERVLGDLVPADLACDETSGADGLTNRQDLPRTIYLKLSPELSEG
jgi:hypothetical protein